MIIFVRCVLVSLLLAICSMWPAAGGPCQSRWLGARALQMVASRAASLPVHVTMLKSNPRARKFYERRGYQLSGEAPS
jgi:hypothetical protein